jgi:hypothetical protein
VVQIVVVTSAVTISVSECSNQTGAVVEGSGVESVVKGPVAWAVLGPFRDLDLDAVRRELDDDQLVVWPVHLAGVRLRLPRETVDRHQFIAEQARCPRGRIPAVDDV